MTKQISGIALAILMIWGFLTDVHAAKIKDIRIGLHRGFARVVFQMDAIAAIEGPVIQEPGKYAIKLKETESLFTSTIPRHAKARVEGIRLTQEGTDLIAELSLGFDAFKVNSFSLPNPPRIVLDIYGLQNEAKTDTKEMSTVPTKDRPLEALNQSNRVKTEPSPLQAEPSQPVDRLPTLGPEEKNTPIPVIGTSPENKESASKPTTQNDSVLPTSLQEASKKPTVTLVQGPGDSLRFYLIAVLGLSVVILILLCVLIFKGVAISATVKPSSLKSENRYDKTVSGIDAQINAKLDELGQYLHVPKQ